MFAVLYWLTVVAYLKSFATFRYMSFWLISATAELKGSDRLETVFEIFVFRTMAQVGKPVPQSAQKTTIYLSQSLTTPLWSPVASPKLLFAATQNTFAVCPTTELFNL